MLNKVKLKLKLKLIFVILVLCLIIGCGKKTGKIRPTAEKVSFFRANVLRAHVLLSTKEEFTQVYCGAKKKVDFCVSFTRFHASM